MKKMSPLLLAPFLMCTFTTAGAAGPPGVLATLQATTSTLLKQAAAQLAAGHPAQAAALYLGAGDAAVAAHQLDAAAAAYQKAADAFHVANDPGNEATAYERMADVYTNEAGVTTPAASPSKPPKPAPAPAAQAPVRPAAAEAQGTIAHPTAVMDPAHGNWLLGEWRVADPACTAEAREIYTQGSWSRFLTDKGWKPGWTDYKVHYVVSKEDVWITFIPSYGSIPGQVFWIDANHYKDTLGCIYIRVK